MASILSLPEELLLQTITYYEDDRSTLLKLSSVSHRFHTLTKKLIFRDIYPRLVLTEERDLMRSEDKHTSETEDPSYTPLIKRTLEENPDLHSAVRSCGPVDLPQTRHGDDWHVSNSNLELLSKFSNLRHLHIRCTRGQYDEPKTSVASNFFESPLLDQLTSITLIGDPFKATILRVLQLRNLKHLTTSLESTNYDFPKLAVHKISGLRRLTLLDFNHPRGPRLHIEPGTLQEFLTLCPHLEELQCQLPVKLDFWGFPPPEYNLKCEGLASSLHLVRTTLKKLDLTMTVPIVGEIIDTEGVPVDLSRMEAVVDLKICAFYLFRFMTFPDPERNNLPHYLPRNLETLTLECPPQVGAMWNHYDAEDEGRTNKKEGIPPERYEWIMCLASCKPTHFPNLHTVHIRDQKLRRTYSVTLVKWEQPEHVRETFKNAGIELEVEYYIHGD